MTTSSETLPDDVGALKAALLAERAARREFEARASGAEAMVAHLKLLIAKLKRDRFGASAERGRMGWQKAAGYNWRALIEADISRYKRVIGDALRSRTDARQATEVVIAVRALNRMLELGRPESVRIA